MVVRSIISKTITSIRIKEEQEEEEEEETSYSQRFPGGNQVDDLPPDRHLKLQDALNLRHSLSDKRIREMGCEALSFFSHYIRTMRIML